MLLDLKRNFKSPAATNVESRIVQKSFILQIGRHVFKMGIFKAPRVEFSEPAKPAENFENLRVTAK